MPSAEFDQLVSMIKRSREDRAEITIELYRDRMDQIATQFPMPADMTAEPVDAGGVPCEWVVVGEPADDAVIFYIHGGCYVSGSVGSIREFAARLSAASRARVLTVDYRLAPEHPCPAALDDVACAYNWLVSDVGASRVVVAGESAGGGLTVALMVALRDSGRALPAAAVPISPWADLSMTNPSLTGNEEADALGQLGGLVMGAEAYLGDRPATDPQASPVHADLAGMPPMLVQVGTGEILFDDAVQLVGALERAGGDVLFERYEEMFHIWHYFGAFLPEGQAATDAIATFVRKHVPFIA